MKYNYIFFNSKDDNRFQDNPDGYYTICIGDLFKMGNMQVVTYPFDYAPKFIRILFHIYCNSRFSRYLPFQKLWYSGYFRNHFNNDKPLCFVFGNHALPLEYYHYLKQKYSKARFVKIHRDLVSKFKTWYPYFTDDVVDEIFDLNLSFDEGDAKKYGWPWFCEFESYTDIKPSLDKPKYDVFFAGVVKDRLPKLLEAYDRITSAGYTCNYYLLRVPKDQQVEKPGIEYATTYLTYREMLQRSIDSRCMLDVNQGDCIGYTSRFIEAIMYNKLLITDNFNVQNHPLYNPEYIQCFKDGKDIDVDFINKDTNKIDYGYKNEFSPVHMIEIIDRELSKKFID